MAPEPTIYPCRREGLRFLAEAPERFERSVTVPISAEQAFAAAEDERRLSRSSPTIKQVRWLDPRPFGPGTRRRIEFGDGTRFEAELFVYEPPLRSGLFLTHTTRDMFAAFVELFELEALGPRRCRFTWRVAYEPSAAYAKLPMTRALMGFNLGFILTRMKAEAYGRRLLGRLR